MQTPIFAWKTYVWACLVAVLLLAPSDATKAQSMQETAAYLADIEMLSQQVLAASQRAAEGTSVDEVKAAADEVFALVWGTASGLLDAGQGAVTIHGWKTRWQVDNGHFDEEFAERYGVTPPEIGDPAALGIMGRGRAARKGLQAVIDNPSSSDDQRAAAASALASLNNVIGWMKMDDGVTKGERQPRVDLTREWDSPTEFWLSTADTGWMPEVYSQAINILKVDYDGDAQMARQHAQGMVSLAQKCVDGEDANGNGTVEAAKMEGGLTATLSSARAAGVMPR